MAATDPRLLGLEPSSPWGCIRIPGSMNEFIDRYGILDLDYEQAMAAGKSFWVLQPDRHR